jgi:predicted CoA-binding protein
MSTAPASPMTLNEKVADFLAQKRIAVAGVSATRDLTGNGIYQKLKETGHEVVAILPKATEFEGTPCYPDLGSIPGGVDALMIVTNPNLTLELVRQAIDAGVKRIWMHETVFGAGSSVSQEAVALCREHGIMVIDGTCPMMWAEPVDVGHRCMKWIMRVSGGMPK